MSFNVTMPYGKRWSVGRRPRGPWRSGRLSPSQILALSFLSMITFGTLGLKTLPGLYVGPELGWTDALFTATSATCVTGLVVVDTATYFTREGQLFLLLLIQLGGLGMLGLASFVIVTLGSRLSLRQEALAGHGGAGGAAQDVPFTTLMRDVLVFTLMAEGIGFILLWGLWTISPLSPEMAFLETGWHALFQSVSAFCNAGFSTFSDSLMGMHDRPITQIVVMGGAILGSMGFLTMEEIKLWIQARRRQQTFRMSLHTRLVLVTNAVLIVGGLIVLAMLEWTNPNTLGPLGLLDKLVNAMTSAITSRTVGFNTIDFDEAAPGSKFVTVLLMAIGGSPGGTAGGMKVTTIAIIAAMAWARLRGRSTTDLWDRTLPAATTQRAVGLFAFVFIFMTVGILLLSVIEMHPPGVSGKGSDDHDFLDYMFEVASAANTVGLSTGPTPDLSGFSRLLLVVMMFIGRVGPLAFAAALSRDEPSERALHRYAQEDVIVG